MQEIKRRDKMKVRKEIAKIIFSGKPCKLQEEIKKVDELVNLFRSYARSLVPDMQHYDNNDVKYPYLRFKIICAYKDGYNACREKILNEIDKEE